MGDLEPRPVRSWHDRMHFNVISRIKIPYKAHKSKESAKGERTLKK